jgi:hypothetical protein
MMMTVMMMYELENSNAVHTCGQACNFGSSVAVVVPAIIVGSGYPCIVGSPPLGSPKTFVVKMMKMR